MARAASVSAATPSGTTANAPVCLLHGDDDFAVKQRARQLYQQWCEAMGGMDHEIIDAQVNNSGEALKVLARLREALQTLPFFGTGKVVWCQNCNFLGDDRTASSGTVTTALAEFAQELKEFKWNGVRLLVSAGKVDKRKTFYKTLEKLGTTEAFVAWSLEDKDWAGLAEELALKQLKARQKEISDPALGELIQRVGPHNQQLINEIEKVSLFVGDRVQIELPDVVAVVSRNKQAQAFAVGEALGNRDLPRLLRTLDEELWELRFDKQKSEIGLLYGLITKIRAMLFLRQMVQEKWVKPDADYYRFKTQLEQIPSEQLPQEKKFNPLSMHPFVLHKALGQSGNYTTAELIRAMDLLLQCNRRLVSSGLDAALVLQQALVEIVRGEGSLAVPSGRGATNQPQASTSDFLSPARNERGRGSR